MKKFRALILNKKNGSQSISYELINENQLMKGDTLVRLNYSTINYKDALAITNKRPIIKKWPMIPGVDFAGVIERSSNKNFQKGDKVILNGYGVGESHYGGFSQIAKVNSKWLTRLPELLTPFEAMAIGSAGLTAMLSIMQIQKHLKPSDGKILVTGATGGVGSISVMILSKLGYNVIAGTGKTEDIFLSNLGAKEIVTRDYFNHNDKLLNHQEWIGVIDVVGSKTLANIISRTCYGGIVVVCGLAQGVDLPTNMMPFIIRAITLKGVESIYTSQKLKQEAWYSISKLVNKIKLKKLTTIIKLKEVESYSKKLLNSKIKGRIVVDLNNF
tara:strand:- start:682 stop:1668 length:987 start_codon:yes stop_codon:yes gene_type:complete